MLWLILEGSRTWGSPLNLCEEDILWTKANLSTRLGDAGDMPVSGVPVPRSVEAVVLRCVPAGRRRNHIPGVSHLFGEPESGIPFFVTVSKTLSYCHLDVQVSIKLCKDNGHALGGRFDFVQSFGEETGALPEVYSVQCFSVFFPPWHTLKMVPSLWHSGVSRQGSSAPSRAEGLSLTHLFCTQIRRPLRGCKIEPRGTAQPQGKLRKSSSEGPWLAQVAASPVRGLASSCSLTGTTGEPGIMTPSWKTPGCSGVSCAHQLKGPLSLLPKRWKVTVCL